MPDCKQCHINPDMFHFVEEKDHPCEKKQVIISSDHVFCPQIHKRDKIDAIDFLNIAFIAFRDGMGKNGLRKQLKTANMVTIGHIMTILKQLLNCIVVY